MPKAAYGLDRILELLLDGDWHSVVDLSTKLAFPQERLEAILRFLSQHDFVRFRASDNSVKIQSQLRRLMEDDKNS
jgi:DNA-binding IclR family transcriptional regulator